MKKETIIEPNEHIFKIRDQYIKIVQDALPDRHIELVGGMAVPMIGRSELDILVLTEDVEGDTEKLEAIGFGYRGVSDDAMFLKKKVEGVDVTVQIMNEDNPLVEVRRKMVKLLQTDESLRREYEEFKKTLDGLERIEYRKRKSEWIEGNILPKLN